MSAVPREHPATPELKDWLRQVAQDLKRAEARLQHDVTPQREAVQRELVQAAVSVGRALHLIGADWYTATGTGNTDWKQDSV